jgi:hypothetical protein
VLKTQICSPRVSWFSYKNPGRCLSGEKKICFKSYNCIFPVDIFPVSWIRNGFNADPDPGPGIWWPKVVKFYSWNKNLLFWSKIAIYLSLGLHKGRSSYKRSLRPSKENIQQFKTWNFSNFLIFSLLDRDPDPGSESSPFSWLWIIFVLMDPHPADPKSMQIHADPDPQRCFFPICPINNNTSSLLPRSSAAVRVRDYRVPDSGLLPPWGHRDHSLILMISPFKIKRVPTLCF